ncbi:MAG: hypothetical protein WBQ37_14580 [Candidatus Competibacter sp.]
MDNHEFIDKLLQKPFNPLWIIVICNILDGLNLGLYKNDFVKDAITQWRNNYLIQKNAHPTIEEDKHLQTALDMLSIFLPSSGTGLSKFDARIKCYSPLTKAINSYAHAMNAFSFILRVLHHDDRDNLIADGALGIGKKCFIEDSIPPVRIQPDAGIGRKGGVVFLTSFTDVANLLSNTTKADDIRDKVGLIHWEKNNEYVILEIQASELTLLRQGRPTFADAGSHRRFKALANNRSNKTQSNWGFTVDLDNFATQGKILDGVPERICEYIEANYISHIKLYPLHAVQTENRGMTSKDDDKAYARCLRRKRSINKIKADIKKII